MHYLELYAKNDKDNLSLLEICRICFGMQWSLDKCTKERFKGGKCVKSRNNILEFNTYLRNPEADGSFQIIAIEEGNDTHYRKMKGKIRI